MSATIEINGLKLVTLKEAAKSFSYTRDYVARLAREEKIVATQVGRQWYVDTFSLKNYADMSELEQSVRRQYLSDSRKREQTVKAEVATLKNKIHKKKISYHSTAAKTAVAVLFLGLFSGVGIFSLGGQFVPTPSMGVVADINSPDTNFGEDSLTEARPKPIAVYSTLATNSTNEVTKSVEQIEEGMAGILLLADGVEASHKQTLEVEDLFSDEVSVVTGEDSRGVIVYTDRAGNKRERDFVSIPVSKDATHEVIK